MSPGPKRGGRLSGRAGGGKVNTVFICERSDSLFKTSVTVPIVNHIFRPRGFNQWGERELQNDKYGQNRCLKKKERKKKGYIGRGEEEENGGGPKKFP